MSLKVRCVEVKFNPSGTQVTAVFMAGNAREGMTYVSLQAPINTPYRCNYNAGREYEIEIRQVDDG